MTGSHVHVVKRLNPQPGGAHPCGAHPCVIVTSGITHATAGVSASKTLCGISFRVDNSAVVPAVRSNCTQCVDIVARQVARR